MKLIILRKSLAVTFRVICYGKTYMRKACAYFCEWCKVRDQVHTRRLRSSLAFVTLL